MTEPQHTRPLSYGFIACALVPVALVALYVLIGSIVVGRDVFVFLMVILFGLVVSVPSTVIVGVPYVLLLRKLGWLYAVPVCIGAAVMGALSLWALNYHLNYFPAAGEHAHSMAISAASGSWIPGAAHGLVAGFSICFASGIRWRAPRQPNNSLKSDVAKPRALG
jgi:hypothetical protein